MAMISAPRDRAKRAALMVSLEYRGKLNAIITSPSPLRNSCSKISPAALACTSVTFSKIICM